MFVCVPEPVCQTTSGKCLSSLPSATSIEALIIASPIFLLSLPSLILTFAAEALMMPNALISDAGCFSEPILKLEIDL